MKESISIRFLYGTVIGRVFLKALINPEISKLAAKLLSTKASSLVVPRFASKNNIDMSIYERAADCYESFNDFFTRRKKSKYYPNEHDGLRSPCDALLSVKNINENSIFKIKNSNYSMGELLKDEKLAKEYIGGNALIFRLTPKHYHRYSYCTDGIVTGHKRIEGLLHCVRPIAVEDFEVFTQNSREYQIISSQKYGDIIQMEIGAMLVGKISNHTNQLGINVKCGEEKGYFEYGGSTIMLILPKGLQINKNILKRKTIDGEIPIEMGTFLLG